MINTEQCDQAGLEAAEDRLRKMGFALVEVQSEKELQSMQYLKRRHGDSATEFTERYLWTLTRRSK